MRQLRNIPLFCKRDTPLCALYRLYENLCARDLIMMGYECEYFFFHKEPRWRLCQIADPKDDDPVRYAILASMLDALVVAFNWRLELGLRRSGRTDLSEKRATNFTPEQAPIWVKDVAPLPHTLSLIKAADGSNLGKPNASFLQRNIEAPMGYLYTV